VDVREIAGVERRRPRWRWVEEVDRDDRPKYKRPIVLRQPWGLTDATICHVARTSRLAN
jgi:hypothetical protein